MSQHFATSYISRLVGLPPLVAQAAFDELVGDHATTCVTVAGRCRLKLSARGSASKAGVPGAQPCTRPYRVVPSTLYAGPRRTRVALELWPWSSGTVQLGLQPRVRGARQPPERILAAGHMVLAHMDTMLHAWADIPLTRLADHTPWPTSPPTSGRTPPPASGRTTP